MPTLGSLVTLVSDGSSLSNRDGGLIAFFDNATAGLGNLIANGGSVSAHPAGTSGSTILRALITPS